MTERISPPADLEIVLDDLKAEGVFQTKQKGMMFAAAVGYALGTPRSDIGKAGEGIRFEYFESPRDTGFIDALAVTAGGDLAVLAHEKDEERAALFERYAAAGLVEMRRACFESKLKPLDGLLALMDRLKAKAGGKLPGIGENLARINDLL